MKGQRWWCGAHLRSSLITAYTTEGSEFELLRRILRLAILGWGGKERVRVKKGERRGRREGGRGGEREREEERAREREGGREGREGRGL